MRSGGVVDHNDTAQGKATPQHWGVLSEIAPHYLGKRGAAAIYT